MLDTDPRGSGRPNVDADIEQPRDPEAELVRANVLARLLGEEEGPSKIGRFTLLERVAEGGMGLVFAAYDPELDRKVAVKLLRSDTTDASVRKRIVREAQAMAKLSHPNVAQVYEVGEHQGGTFIAMEFVRGETLRVWQSRAGRHWRETLEVYAQAGRGLAAAHAAGLVHRDFKPDNAIVGRDGRVRVLDFGLARTGEVETTAEIETQTLLPAPHDDAFGTPLTHAGSIMGTPAYMAPEQFLGEEVTAKADQFALCVSLWEGLFGERPFAGTSRADLLANVTRGRLRAVPKESRVPTWVRAVLGRGLAVGPSDRFATTDALLAALENDPSRRRRRVMLAGTSVVALALIAGGVVGFREHQRAEKISACEAAGSSIDEVWNDGVRARVRDALLATSVRHATSTAEKVMPWLDEHARAWREHRTGACMNAEVHHTWDAKTLDRAVWCLDERRLDLASLLTRLEHADGQVAATALPAAAGLPRVSPCVDPNQLATLPSPPAAEDRAALAGVRVELAEGRSLLAAAMYTEALAAARSARQRAEPLGWPPITAAAMTLEGTVLDQAGSYADAETSLVAGYRAAAKAEAWDVAALAATQLIDTVGDTQARHDEGRTWAIHAEVAATLAGDPLGLREADREGYLGSIARAAGRYDEARAHHERAYAVDERALGPDHFHLAARLNSLANDDFKAGAYDSAQVLFERALVIYEKVLGPDHPSMAATLSNLASVHFARGEHDIAEALHVRVLAVREGAFGPDHPHVAMSANNLASVYLTTGRHAQARPLFERALAINERSLGPEHPEVAGALNNLGMLHAEINDHLQAKSLHRRALELREKVLGPDHADVARSLNNLANAHASLGEHAEARDLQTRALAIREAALGPDHPDVARSLSNLAHAYRYLGDDAKAQPLYERALAIREKTLGPNHLDVAQTLVGMSGLAQSQSRVADAVALAERALRIRESGGAPPEVVAESQLGLARLLVAAPVGQGRDRERAVALATAARETFRGIEHEQAAVAEVDAWLASLRRP